MTMLLRIAERVLNRPLLVHPDKVPLMLAVLQGRIPLGRVDELVADAEARIAQLPEEAQAALTGSAPEASRFVGDAIDVDPQTGQTRGLPYRRTAEGVALIPILGALANRGTSLERSSLGKQSYEGIKFQLQTAAADPRTRAVLLDIESPGGEAVGAMEAAAAVRELSRVKPVTAVVNGMAASAAYAIASGARDIVTTPTGVSGSIGVVMLHADFSRALDQEGITPTLIFAGAHKVDGNPFEPLSEEVHSDLQREVEQFYDLFVSAVADGRRSLSPAAVRRTEARIFIGDEAVKAGLADRVGTFEEALADLSRAQPGRIPQRSTRGTAMSEQQQGAPGAESPGNDKPTAPAADAPAAAANAADVKARIEAILTADAAKGREEMANHLAFKTDMPAADAIALMATAPKPAAEEKPADPAASYEASRTAAAGLASPGAGRPQAPAPKTSWDNAVAKVNKRVAG